MGLFPRHAQLDYTYNKGILVVKNQTASSIEAGKINRVGNREGSVGGKVIREEKGGIKIKRGWGYENPKRFLEFAITFNTLFVFPYKKKVTS